MSKEEEDNNIKYEEMLKEENDELRKEMAALQ